MNAPVCKSIVFKTQDHCHMIERVCIVHRFFRQVQYHVARTECKCVSLLHFRQDHCGMAEMVCMVHCVSDKSIAT